MALILTIGYTVIGVFAAIGIGTVMFLVICGVRSLQKR